MATKLAAVPLPELVGKTVLDLGCDHGWWSYHAALAGAHKVLGLDRGREIGGQHVDLIARNREMIRHPACSFERIDLGKQWHQHGKFDVVLCLSMYHHVFENCGDHHAIWFWLWQHTAGTLLWENPTGRDDDVVRRNVARDGYNRAQITRAAYRFFDVDHVGAGHVATREVWRCTPKHFAQISRRGMATSGGGGATRAFEHAGGRRIGEIESILGVRPVPGSLNIRLDHPFSWSLNYHRAEILDPVDRANLASEWRPRWCRFHPVSVEGHPAHAMRFEGESYGDNYVEVIAPARLRDHVSGERVTIWN